MANIEEQYKCQKCGNTLLKSNKMLHDLRCNPSINVISNNSINSIENGGKNNLNNNNNFASSLNNNNFNNSLNNNVNNNNIDPFLIYSNFILGQDNNNDFLCDMCGLKMKLKDKADHLLCHQMNLNENDNNIEDREFNDNVIDPIEEDLDINRNYLFDNPIENRNRLRDRNLDIFNNNRRRIINNSYDEEEEGGNVNGDNSLDDDLFDDYDGLDEDIIQSYPISKIKDINKLDEEKKKCLICLDNFKNNDDSIILPCIHIFHAECIKKWLKNKNSCPICKSKIDNNNNFY